LRPTSRDDLLTLGCARVRLILWNTAGRVSKAKQQVAALRSRAPDVVALQEVRLGAEPVLRAELQELGLEHVVGSRDFPGAESTTRGPRQYGLLLASRWSIMATAPGGFAVPWPERLLSAIVCTPAGAIELHTTGIPPGATNGWTKIEMFEGIYTGLARSATTPRLLCGDFNSPREERPDGQVVTWGQKVSLSGDVYLPRGRTDKFGRTDSAERWDRAERNLLVGLALFDLHDVFRSVHGYGKSAASSYWRSGARVVGRRFDHIFASRSLTPSGCDYLDSFRAEGLSDHAPIEASFQPASFQGVAGQPS
jgi:exonuclease III